ncbi:hypothetical protein HK102_007637 [Quaeritorhiza haematococci]|nr:hypothetical protein HK102_007637 [Quaeritorhiza haematococci]
MGMENVLKWLRRHFPSAFSPALSRLPCDRLYIDLNCLIHRAAAKSQTSEHCHKRIFKRLDRITKGAAFANKLIFISIDGPGPLAKLALQRKRRQEKAKRALAKKTFDTRQVTPGCNFMLSLDDHLEFYACRALLGQKPGFKYIVSGSCVPGEGEVKIVDHIMADLERGVGEEDSVCIVGSDSDIVVQVMLADLPNVTVLNLESNEIFSISALYPTQNGQVRRDDPGRRAVFDLGFLLLMTGNDYIPKILYHKMDHLWKRYCTVVAKGPPTSKQAPQSSAGTGASPGKRFSADTDEWYLVDVERKAINLLFLRELLSVPPRLELIWGPRYRGGRSASAAAVAVNDMNGIAAGSSEGLMDDDAEKVSDEEDENDDEEDDGNGEATMDTDEDDGEIDSTIEMEHDQHPTNPPTAAYPTPTPVSSQPAAQLTDHEQALMYLRLLTWYLHTCIEGVCPDYEFQYPCSDAPTRASVVEVLDMLLKGEVEKFEGLDGQRVLGVGSSEKDRKGEEVEDVERARRLVCVERSGKPPPPPVLYAAMVSMGVLGSGL